MTEPVSMSFAVFWKTTIHFLIKFLPSLAGSFLAVLTFKYDESTPLWTRVFRGFVVFISGVCVAHFLGSAIVDSYPNISGVTEDGLKFALGIFGLTLINNLTAEISPWLTSFRKKLFGAENA